MTNDDMTRRISLLHAIIDPYREARIFRTTTPAQAMMTYAQSEQQNHLAVEIVVYFIEDVTK